MHPKESEEDFWEFRWILKESKEDCCIERNSFGNWKGSRGILKESERYGEGETRKNDKFVIA